MTSDSWRSTITLIIAASLVAATFVVGGAIGQTDAGTNESATDDGEVPTQDTSYLRVAHVAPDAPPVDVFVDGERVLANVSFGEVTDYEPHASGEHEVRIAVADGNETDGNETAVFEGNVTLEPRSVTTLFASGEVGENASATFEPVLFEDDAFVPDENESTVSVAHMAPGAPAVDVTAENGSVVLADDLEFRNASQYVTVPAGDYTVEIRPASEGNNATPLTTVDVSLEGGTAYSAIATGYLNGDATGDNAFRVSLVEDATKTIHLPGEETPATETATEEPTETATEEPTEAETPTETPEA